MAAHGGVDYIGYMRSKVVAVSLLLTTCGVAHPGNGEGPVAQLSWDEGSEAGWTVTDPGYVELPARHLTKTVSADEKLVTVVDATGATFIAQLRRAQGPATLLPADEHLSSSGPWTHLTVHRARRPDRDHGHDLAGDRAPSGRHDLRGPP